MSLIIVIAKFILVVILSLQNSYALSVKDATNHCIMVSVSEGELSMMKELGQQLHEYLQNNMKSGHEILNKAMSKYSGISLKIPLSDPLISHVFQLQLLLHQQTVEMIQKLGKAIIYNKGIEKTNSTNENQMENEDQSKDIRAQKEFAAYALYNLRGLDIQKLGTLSPWGNFENKFYAPTDSHFRPHDCSDLLIVGASKSGVYDIYPFKCSCAEPIKVYCDMETDGGGWTVILARMKQTNQLNFTRSWAEYKNGFGSAEKEYYIGNEKLHQITSSRKYQIRFDVNGTDGRYVWGEWKTFVVDTEVNKYKLTLAGYDNRGTMYDITAFLNNMKFSTFDMDNDGHAKEHCAVTRKGGFWYKDCTVYSFTGLYGSFNLETHEGLKAYYWSKTDRSQQMITWVQVKIRPSICSETVSVAALNTHNCLNRN